MNATPLPALPVEAAAYVALQREMHDALLRQHPEWMERDGNCPKCDEYDHRLARLLSLFLTFKHADALGRDAALRRPRSELAVVI
jgi:hypothetical protein